MFKNFNVGPIKALNNKFVDYHELEYSSHYARFNFVEEFWMEMAKGFNSKARRKRVQESYRKRQLNIIS